MAVTIMNETCDCCCMLLPNSSGEDNTYHVVHKRTGGSCQRVIQLIHSIALNPRQLPSTKENRVAKGEAKAQVRTIWIMFTHTTPQDGTSKDGNDSGSDEESPARVG